MGLGMLAVYVVFVVLATIMFSAGFKIVNQTERGLIERFGKYRKYAEPGLHLIIPFVDKMVKVDVTENMVDADSQEIITSDKLNAKVDAQIYFRVKPDEKNLYASRYNVSDYYEQIVSLTRTTLRNIIGTMTLKDANSERGKINDLLMTTLKKETVNWGIDVVRAELKEISPPPDVQETMNEVVKASNAKEAAIDFASSRETEADGLRRAEIKKAEGVKQAKILAAEGEATAIKLINEASNKYFVGNAQLLKRLEVTEASLARNSKIVLTEKGISPVIVFGDSGVGSVLPLKNRREEEA